MKGLTEIKAIKLSLDMWKWLYENPLKDKDDYPYYKKYKIDEMLCECPCCEYYVHCADDGCPLNATTICDSNEGHFYQWSFSLLNGDKKQSEKHSLVIVKLLQKKYDMLLKKDKIS